jgi:peptidoglycan L-alanyl-D-glutamate endopeptidase CwlK
MPAFGNRSKENLAGCTPEVRVLCNEGIKVIDFAVTTGHRTDEEQGRLYSLGRTEPGRIVTYKKAGESVHNWRPSPAFDFAPWPIDWNDLVRFGEVAGVLKYIAWQKGIDLEWGGDWPNFKDYPHMQIGV